MKLRHLSLVYEQQNPESSMWILGYQVPVCSFGVCWYPQLHQKENIQRNFAARGCFSLNKKNMFCWKLLSLWGGWNFPVICWKMIFWNSSLPCGSTLRKEHPQKIRCRQFLSSDKSQQLHLLGQIILNQRSVTRNIIGLRSRGSLWRFTFPDRIR